LEDERFSAMGVVNKKPKKKGNGWGSEIMWPKREKVQFDWW